MKVSAVIAHRNDPYIEATIEALSKSSIDEIVVVDDASDQAFNYDFSRPITLIQNQSQRGVGYCFDKGVHEASGDIVILMGSDVIVKDDDWLSEVKEYVTKYPKGIGCSVCLSGDPEHINPLDPADSIKRYGATILPFSTTEDLSSDSMLLERSEYYVGAWDSKWIKVAPTVSYDPVPCVYGAFYFARKSWYKQIRGWDTDFTKKLSGHSLWGSLEAWLSLKNFLYGGMCHVVPAIETLHVFHKYQQGESPHGRTDRFWYNKMFISYTMLEEEDAKRLLKTIYDLRVKYGLHTLPFNLGKKLLMQNWKYVQDVKYRNELEFTNSFDDFCRAFNIDKKW